MKRKMEVIKNNTQTQEEVSVIEQLVDKYDLVVYNDDVNTFDFVIESLIKVCEHNTLQAEQCTLIIHHNGKCQVKRGNYEHLEPMCTALLDRGISAVIE
ncbi:MAG: ATP-dependent Clp protease adaptor ClpS [Crocinitomicaceae bacterium]|nr:ATP-dependent Clp protease adaptor ClpS [Crocinitomicaceae bacterium]